MRMFYLIFLVVLVSSTKGIDREIVVGEITHVSAEQSRTFKSYEAGNAIDRDLSTLSIAQPGSDGITWLKVKIEQVYCIDRVVVHYSRSSSYFSFTCTQYECTCVPVYLCTSVPVYLSVYTEGNTTSGDLQPTSGCRLGDSVKLYRKDGGHIPVYELEIPAILGTYRETVPGEITPLSAEQTRTYKSGEAWYAIDRDWSTRSYTHTGDDGTTWLKVNLGQVYCIDRVVVYFLNYSITNYFSYSCTQEECTCDQGWCMDNLLSVYNESTTTYTGNLPSITTGCRLGDTVKLYGSEDGSYVLAYELVITACSANCTDSEMVPGEITPVSAEQSRTQDIYEGRFAIDRNMSTPSIALPGDDGTLWLKVKLGQVYCIDRVGAYTSYSPYSSPYSWTCAQDECLCEGLYCYGMFVSVYTESTTSTGTLPSTTGCRLGDTVKIFREHANGAIIVNELLITAKLERRRDHTESRVTVPTTEPPMIGNLLDIDGWRVNDVVRDHEEPETVHGRDHYWDKDFKDPIFEYIVPEICHLTPENCTVYNSFLLDCNCIKEFESVSPECRSFKCDVVHYFLAHGADIFAKFVRSGSIKEAVQVIHKELTSLFEDLNVCKCGKEFLGAAFRSAPFYNGNALLYAFYDKEDVVRAQRILRSVDFKSASKFFDRLIDGICAETRGGRCLNSILTGLEEVAEIVENTMTDYEDYDEGDRKYQKREEKRCDALFGPIRAWEESEIDFDDVDEEEDVENLFDKTGVFMNSFYCDKGCKKERRSLYPCCMRTLLEDKKLFNGIEKVIVSIYRAMPAIDNDFEFDDFAELDSDFDEEYDLEEIFAWTVPESIRDAFMRTIHAAKYCQGKTVKCSDNRRPEA